MASTIQVRVDDDLRAKLEDEIVFLLIQSKGLIINIIF